MLASEVSATDAGSDRAVVRTVAARRAPRRAVAVAVLGGLLFVAIVLSLAIGAKSIPTGTVLEAFTDFDSSNADHLVVRELRLPRTIVGLLVGVALGVSGAVMQAVTRNSLADPGILGVNAGASFAVVIGIFAFGVGSTLGLVWFAFAGAALASVIVYLLGSVGGGAATPVRLATSRPVSRTCLVRSASRPPGPTRLRPSALACSTSCSASDRSGRCALVSSGGVATATSLLVITVCPSRQAGRSAFQARPVTPRI